MKLMAMALPKHRLFFFALFLCLLLALSRFSSTNHSVRLRDFESTSSDPRDSFVESLENFLATRVSTGGTDILSQHLDVATSAKRVEDLDHAVRKREIMDLPSRKDNRLRVYVYDMPSKFTYDLLFLFHGTYNNNTNMTSNGSPVHRLIEQEALEWVTNQPPWQRLGGRDHVLPVHHPWSFKSHRRYMKHAIWLLPDMDSTGNWYKPGEVSLEKDVIAPYVPNVEVCDGECLAQSSPHRHLLLFFRGRTKRNAGGKVRSRLVAILKDEPGVVIEEGSSGGSGQRAAQNGMRRSLFCLSPAGDTPSSARLFDAIVSGCIPVIVSDELELPFEGLLDYREMVVFVSSMHAIRPGWLVNYLRTMNPLRIKDLQSQLAKYSKHFQYSNPAQPLGAEDMIWRMIAAKVPFIKLHARRAQRAVEGTRSSCSCECRNGNQSTLISH